MKSAGEVFLSGLRGAKNFSVAFRIVFRILFRVFQTVFSYRFKSFSGSVSFCRHAALKYLGMTGSYDSAEQIQSCHKLHGLKYPLTRHLFAQQFPRILFPQFFEGFCAFTISGKENKTSKGLRVEFVIFVLQTSIVSESIFVSKNFVSGGNFKKEQSIWSVVIYVWMAMRLKFQGCFVILQR